MLLVTFYLKVLFAFALLDTSLAPFLTSTLLRSASTKSLISMTPSLGTSICVSIEFSSLLVSLLELLLPLFLLNLMLDFDFDGADFCILFPLTK